MRMHRDLGMIMPAEELRPFHADGAITERRPFGGAGHDADVLRHGLILGERAGCELRRIHGDAGILAELPRAVHVLAVAGEELPRSRVPGVPAVDLEVVDP